MRNTRLTCKIFFQYFNFFVFLIWFGSRSERQNESPEILHPPYSLGRAFLALLFGIFINFQCSGFHVQDQLGLNTNCSMTSLNNYCPFQTNPNGRFFMLVASFSGLYCSITHFTWFSMSTGFTYEHTTVILSRHDCIIISLWIVFIEPLLYISKPA